MVKAFRAITVEELKAHYAKGGKVQMPGDKIRYGKYNAKPVTTEGITYHSTAEYAFKLRLDLLKANGIIDGFTRQVPFWIPGEPKASKYVLDFMPWKIIGGLPTLRFVEVKGYMKTEEQRKINQVQHLYKIRIEVIAGSKNYSWTW